MERGYRGHYLTNEIEPLLLAAAGVDHFSQDTADAAELFFSGYPSCLHLPSRNSQNETGRRLGTEQNA
jgi:hypothetical protein